MSRAKLCVCGASSQLGRERSRLVKAEQMILKRLRGISEREGVLKGCDKGLQEREEELHARQEEQHCKELAVLAKLESLRLTAERAGQRREALRERENRALQHRQELLRTQHRVEKRLERIAATRGQHLEDKRDVDALEDVRRREAEGVASMKTRLDAAEESLHVRREQLGSLHVEIDKQRAVIKADQDTLEPVQAELQAREVEINERKALLEQRRAALNERKDRLRKMREETEAALSRKVELEKQAEEAELRLTRLWDDIHQRQQVLEDIDTSLWGREERLTMEQRDLLVSSQGAPELEPLALELAAAELAERARREQSAAFARRSAELEAVVRELEGHLAAPGGEQSKGEVLREAMGGSPVVPMAPNQALAPAKPIKRPPTVLTLPAALKETGRVPSKVAVLRPVIRRPSAPVKPTQLPLSREPVKREPTLLVSFPKPVVIERVGSAA